MHRSVMMWVRGEVAEHGLAGLSTLEVGSLNVNGSVRGLFSGPYVGVDAQDGDGVDAVIDAHALEFASAAFDVVVSTEMLEHDSAFWLSMAEMGRVLRPGGHLLLTARGVWRSETFHQHSYPNDYFRFMPQSGAVLLELAKCDLVSGRADWQHPGIFVHGVRR